MSRTIIVAPLARAGEMAARYHCRHMLSLMANGHDFAKPGIVESHHTLRMNDIAFAGTGKLVGPGAQHVSELMEFARRWAFDGPLLVHCWLGVSRSPAAALLVALALLPGLSDAALAGRLRSAAPFATPNRRLIALGDEALGREGRLIEAVAEIGRGAECATGLPFVLDLS
ncbi:tyrosine phosphatase family protein [Martelella endophytica]|uniref:Protein tyrosine phosphatase n=1 Tax=Martelella endophytica TaxID=1486262 RepID=A0A0D5LTB1_MAREN|nr:protein-tyrosine-phosphatase [Martelella endophytica]AJY46608.1 protein tyrosine phosphatase [Martelella endophytica]